MTKTQKIAVGLMVTAITIFVLAWVPTMIYASWWLTFGSDDYERWLGYSYKVFAIFLVLGWGGAIIGKLS